MEQLKLFQSRKIVLLDFSRNQRLETRKKFYRNMKDAEKVLQNLWQLSAKKILAKFCSKKNVFYIQDMNFLDKI